MSERVNGDSTALLRSRLASPVRVMLVVGCLLVVLGTVTSIAIGLVGRSGDVGEQGASDAVVEFPVQLGQVLRVTEVPFRSATAYEVETDGGNIVWVDSASGSIVGISGKILPTGNGFGPDLSPDLMRKAAGSFAAEMHDDFAEMKLLWEKEVPQGGTFFHWQATSEAGALLPKFISFVVDPTDGSVSSYSARDDECYVNTEPKVDRLTAETLTRSTWQPGSEVEIVGTELLVVNQKDGSQRLAWAVYFEGGSPFTGPNGKPLMTAITGRRCIDAQSGEDITNKVD